MECPEAACLYVFVYPSNFIRISDEEMPYPLVQTSAAIDVLRPFSVSEDSEPQHIGVGRMRGRKECVQGGRAGKRRRKVIRRIVVSDLRIIWNFQAFNARASWLRLFQQLCEL